MENGDSEPKVRQEGETSEGGDEQLEEDLNSSCALRQIMGDLSKEELDQSVNLFHARFRIMEYVCSLVIDGRSEALLGVEGRKRKENYSS